jgi:hypothetical protein
MGAQGRTICGTTSCVISQTILETTSAGKGTRDKIIMHRIEPQGFDSFRMQQQNAGRRLRELHKVPSHSYLKAFG